jgi:hypothetical protein
MAMRSRTRTRRLLGLLALLGLLPLPAAAGGNEIRTLRAVPISEPIRLDGRFDEPAWQNAPAATDFVQREPDTGRPSSQRTEVRVVYTPQTLYVAVNALDDEPSRIISKEMQRDEPLWRDDAVDVLFDTFDDDRNAYLFETNPNGARTDALITDEGRSFNLQWDGVWDVAARRTATGWTAEIAIPFSTLRFDPSAGSWGFNVLRYVRRRAEQAFWAPILLDADVKRVSLYGRLEGISGVEPGLNLNVKPFTVATANKAADPATGREKREIDFGGDLKWGITRGLSLDLTVNTDFAETEVDALQVNLTRFPLFFPEKRYFFLENAGIYDFGPRETNTTDAPLMKLFFSRRIGLGPNGEQVPVEWGTRLSGRVGEWSVGLLDVQTDAAALGGGVGVPRDNWAALRATRNFGRRSSVGAMLTQRHNEGNTNLAYGLDLSFKPTTQLGFESYASGTDNSKPGGASDWAGGAAASWAGSVFVGRLGFDHIGEDFDPQAGFLLRRGIDRYTGRATWEPRPSSGRLMNLHFELDSRVFANLDGGIESQRHRLDLFGLRTKAATEAYLFAVHNFEKLEAPFTIAPGVTIAPGEYPFDDLGVRYLTHSSRPVSVEGNAEIGGFYDGSHVSNSFTLRLRPNRYLRSESVWQLEEVNLPAGDFTANILRQRFALALTPRMLANVFLQYNDLADLVSLNMRFNWTYRPGSDVYVVFNQRWSGAATTPAARRDWQLQAKLTYLFQR